MYRAIKRTECITVKKLDRNNQIPINTLAQLNSYEVSAHSGNINHSYRLESMNHHWIKVKTVKLLNNMSNPCDENQLHTPFILSLFRQSTSTCFGHICSPSSGGILYVYNTWYILCFLVDCLLTRSARRQSTKKHSMYQLLYTYSIPPDDGLQICPKHVEVDWRNKLRINSASSWFSLHGCIEMHDQQNIKFNMSNVLWDVVFIVW